MALDQDSFGAPERLPADIADDTRDSYYVPAPCQVACPIGTDAPSYLAYIWEQRFEEAFEAITATNPFSSVCGRVCDAPCEPACRRTESDGALAIRNLKRFVMERLGKDYHLPPVPVTQEQTIGIVGSGPTGLTAAQDLAEAGYEVHIYELSNRLGGMMIWGIPAFRLPPEVLQEDIDRMLGHCPGIKVHLETALGRDITLDELKERHDAVLLAIGSWWGKPMKIEGEDRPEVVDGVGFLRRVNGGERPTMPESVLVVGGGDVAMDACRVAKRLPGCKDVKVIYRRGPDEIPARRDELKGAIAEGIEFVYHRMPVAVVTEGNGIALSCVKTALGEPDPEDGRRLFKALPESEHDIPCGMVIAAVGQQAECDELDGRGLMEVDRVRAEFEGMSTEDPKVFAAGDGAFGGSTLVIAMYHGHRASYYMKAYLQGIEEPIPYKTPYRTRRVPVAQDLWWEKFPRQEQNFLGLGKDPVQFPEIEETYDLDTALNETARCYRCDSETGSTDYSVANREDIFVMARTNPKDHRKKQAMLHKRLATRDDPVPAERPATLDDIVFLPANLSRLVIDPYREACNVATKLAGKLALAHPFIVTGFDDAPEEVRSGVALGLAEGRAPYLGLHPIGPGVPWFQLALPGQIEPSGEAAALVQAMGHQFSAVVPERLSEDQLLGIALSSPAALEQTIAFALEQDIDFLLLDGSAGLGTSWAELRGAPDLSMLRDAIAILRRLDREEEIDLVYFGGVRSGTDAAKLIGLGANAVLLGVPAGLAVGGRITESRGFYFEADYTDEDRSRAIVNILKASTTEASMMARCTGKTDLYNIEPEDLRSITITTAKATGLPIVGQNKPLPPDFAV